jgi:hypothetical protein
LLGDFRIDFGKQLFPFALLRLRSRCGQRGVHAILDHLQQLFGGLTIALRNVAGQDIVIEFPEVLDRLDAEEDKTQQQCRHHEGACFAGILL